jgi:hypothetical protein
MRRPGWLSPFDLAAPAAAAALALAWWGFHHWKEANRVLTPHQRRLPLAPLYAFWQPEWTGWAVAAAVLLIAAVLAWRAIPEGRERLFLVFALAVSIGFRFLVHAAPGGELPGRQLRLYPGEDIIYDAARITSPREFLRDYTTLQPRLSLHGQHQPPGFALFDYFLLKVLGDDVVLVGSVLTVLAGLIVLTGYGIGSRLRGRPGDGRACAMLLAVLPSTVAFGAVTLDGVFAVVAALVYLVLLVEIARPRPFTPFLLGVLLFLAMMLSYSAFLVGLFCAVALALFGWRRPLALSIRLLQVAAAFLLPFLLLHVFSGFDAWTCFANARRLNTALMAETVGLDWHTLPVRAYTAAGNLLAFLIDLGPAVLAGYCLLPFRRLGPAERRLGLAFVTTLAVACCGGLYFMETERIFLFLAPLAVLLAVIPDGFRPRAAAFLAGAQAIVMAVTLNTLW